MQRIKAVIFDMDGVIFDSESVWKILFEIANKKYGLALTEEYRKSICGKNELLIRQELKEILPGTDVDEYRDFIITGVREWIEKGCFEVKPGFMQLMDYLKKMGCKIALATSSEQKRAEQMFNVKGLDCTTLFDTCVFGNDVGIKCKLDPYIFTLAADRLCINPCECVVIEDSINGIQAAVNGGFIPVMAVDLIEPDSFCYEKCSCIIRSLEEFNLYIGELK
ncbi:MAG: HAD family phosphatase [Ruminococcaceae bacterium]|nr:HAD family phosphatase [Oscillospiraceae bacterium]